MNPFAPDNDKTKRLLKRLQDWKEENPEDYEREFRPYFKTHNKIIKE
jgi:hypothetical protein